MKINILIVDDCPVMRMVIKRAINLCDFDIGEIEEAENGKEALRKIEKNTFSLVILDLNMPVMTGSEVLAHIKLNPSIKRMPILTVSAESNGPRVDIVSDLSSDFLHKPFSVEALRDKMLKLLKKDSITISETGSQLVINSYL
ncbi:MAG: two-component system response regulator [Balneola sp.]|jgi:CheY-like chemotaxis protein|nr:two-component system response regulator [Balneola sp.]MBE79141.1 two-component system response regulator [Balneola sp.]|tara:strand:+ start:9125 stop:9553 length:429 start_codon:yes stop_codon:yes gene_type:complete